MAAAAGERVLVATVCGGLPSSEVSSPLLDKIHRVRNFADGVAYVSARREEDRAAAAVLGAEIEWGPSLDAIYRRPADYFHSAALQGPAASGDTLLSEAVRMVNDLHRRFPQAKFYAPLGLVGHIDHRVVSTAARMAGGDICFYEEFPRGAVPRSGQAEVISIGIHMNQRIAAVLCYRSQIRPLFGDEDAARAAITAQVVSTGGERIWRF